MKRTTISAVLALALGSSLANAEAGSSLEEAFKNGQFEGHVAVYGQYQKNKDADPKKVGFSSGSASIGYETAPLHGVSLGLGAWGTTKFGEKNDGYDETIESNAIFHKAFIKVAHEGMGEVVVGRQEVDLEWLTDYIEGAVGSVTPVENLSIVLGWANRQAVVDFDEVSERFEKMNASRGVYVLDVKYSPLEWLELNPYVYYAPEALRAPGLKATATLALSEDFTSSTMAQYVAADVDSKIQDHEDGYVAQIEQNLEFFGANAGVGYIKTDKKGGAGYGANVEDGILASYGDQNPLEEGNWVYGLDAKTYYLKAGYEYEGFSFEALYGETKYFSLADDKKLKEKELDLSVGYGFIKNLDTELIYARVKNDNREDSYNIVKALAKYSF